MLIKGRVPHLRDYLRVLKKRSGISLIVASAIFSLVLVGTLATTPQYEGTTKVLIEKGESGDLNSRSRRSYYDQEQFYRTQVQVIKSRAVSRRVVDMLSLKEDSLDLVLGEEKPSPLRPVWTWLKTGMKKARSFFSGGEEGETENGRERSWKDKAANAISKNMDIRPIADSQIVTINYISPYPEFAAMVSNTTAKAYIEEILNMKMEATRGTLDWMTKKAQSERLKLEAAEKALQKYMKEKDIVTLENRIAVTPEKLSEISIQLVRAESRRKEVESLYGQVKKVARDPDKAMTVAAIASDEALRALRAQIVESEKKVMELSGKYGHKHPLLAKAIGDLNVLKKKKNQEIQRKVQSIKNDYDLALAHEKNLRSQLEKIKTETLGLNEKFIQYGALKREVDTSRKLYDALVLRLKEQSITEETRPVSLWVVEEAAIPTNPVRPRNTLNLLIGLILGLAGGIGLAFFLEYLDNKIRDPEETEAALDTQVLGIISLYRGKEGEVEGVELREPLSAIAEGYKALRTALLLSVAGAQPRKILITSPSSGEGKSATAVNLALGLAQSEKRVVLIDADMRKPRIHKIFGLNNEKGLSTFLAGSPDTGILQKGALPNLSVITSGPIPPNPPDLLVSSRMQELLRKLDSSFDIIICDTPPLLSVTDCRVLSRLFDGTLLVTRSEQTTYEMAGRALKSLHDVSARVFGLVINAVDLKKSDYFYYNEYYSAYGEKQEEGPVAEPKKVAEVGVAEQAGR